MEEDRLTEEERDENDEGKDLCYTSIPYGLQLLQEFVSSSKHCDLQGVFYNNKTNEYILLDSRGVSKWRINGVRKTIKRLLDFEAYKFNSIRSLVYSRFYNVYFALTKDYGIKVYNLNFHEICYTASDGNSVSRLLYNMKRNELITICRDKLRFWKYSIRERNSSFHGISMVREFEVAESLMLSNAEFDEDLQRIYLMSDNNIYCYSVEGKCLFHVKGNAIGYFCTCAYSKEANLLIAGNINGQISIFNPTSGLVTTLLNHSNIVTSIVIHPSDGQMFFSASLDGTIKLFSLQMLGEIYSINVFSEGVLYMRIPTKNTMYASSRKGAQVFDINYSFKFWSTSRSPVRRMNITQKLSNIRRYVLVFTEDYSIRLYNQRTGQRRSTILPPPEIAIGEDVISIAFDRLGKAMYILFQPLKLWIYSTRTDPATRVATWDLELSIRTINELRDQHTAKEMNEETKFGASSTSQKEAEGNIVCHSLLTINRDVFSDEEPESEYLNFGFLLCGLSNGLICILDPCDKGSLLKSLQAHNTSPVIDMQVDYRKAEAHLLTLIETINGLLVRVWNLQTMEYFLQLGIQQNYTQLLYKNYQLVVGYYSGYLHNEMIHLSVRKGKSEVQIPATHMKDHDGAILSVDIQETSNLICSCGEDHFVRIWDSNKALLTEIKFDETLKYAVFLDNLPQVLISFRSQLFVIPYYCVLNANIQTSNCDDVSSGDESFIYEDPLVRNEAEAIKNRGKMLTTLANYLVPYPNLGLESLWMLQGSIADGLSEQEQDSDGEVSIISKASNLSNFSFASTAIYQDSLDGSVVDVEDISFPRCDDSPVRFVVADDDSVTDVDSIAEEIEEVVSDQDVIIEHSEKSLTSSSLKFRRDSLYDLLRKKTEQIPGKSFPTTSSSTRQTKISSDLVPTSKTTLTPQPKKKKTKQQRQQRKKVNRIKSTNLVTNPSTENNRKASKHEQEELLGNLHNEISQNKDVDELVNQISVFKDFDEAEGTDEALPSNTPTVLLTNDSDVHLNEESQTTDVQQEPKPAIPFSAHHRSLFAMATGKSERHVSNSYQQVMTSLMNTGNQTPVSLSPEHLDNEEEDEDKMVGSKFDLLSEYEADHEDNSSKRPLTRPTPVRSRPLSVKTGSIPRPKQPHRKTGFRATVSKGLIPNEQIKASLHTISSQKLVMPKQLVSKHIPVKPEIQENNENNNQPEISPPKILLSTTESNFRDFEDGVYQVNKKPSEIEKEDISEVSMISDPHPPSYVHTSKSSLSTSVVLSPSQQNMQAVEMKMMEFDTSFISKAEQNINQEHDVGVNNVQSTVIENHLPNRLRKIVQTSIKEQQQHPKNNDFTSVILHLSAKMKSKQKEKQERKTKISHQTTGFAFSNSDTNNTVSVDEPHIRKVRIARSTSSIKMDGVDTNENNNNIPNLSHQREIKHNKKRGSVATITHHAPTLASFDTPNPPHPSSAPSSHPASVAAASPQRRLTLADITSSTDLFVTASPVNRTTLKKDDDMSPSVPQQQIKTSESHSVIKFIVSSFKKPKSATKKERVQFQLNEGTNVKAETDQDPTLTVLEESQNDPPLSIKISVSASPDVEEKVFITPKNSETSMNEYSPVSSVFFRCQSQELTSDESALFRNRSSLYDKLQKHRQSKQKQKARYESIQTKRSASSGYDTTSRDYLLESELSMRTWSSQSRQRLSVKRSPIYFGGNRSVTPDVSKLGQRNSEIVYFEDYLPTARPMDSQSRRPKKSVNKKDKIKNLEQKLSGQNHRFHTTKTAHEIEADRLALLMLKKKSGVRLPVEKTSVSIPGRIPHEVIQEYAASHDRRTREAILS